MPLALALAIGFGQGGRQEQKSETKVGHLKWRVPTLVIQITLEKQTYYLLSNVDIQITKCQNVDKMTKNVYLFWSLLAAPHMGKAHLYGLGDSQP
jgi:hypothetical protein